MTAIKADYDFSGFLPDIVVASNGSQITIIAEVIAHDPLARQTGKYIHLGMTSADAVRLLNLLRSAQQQFGWPDLGPVTVSEVPPDRQKN